MTTSTSSPAPRRRPNRRGQGSRLRDDIVQAGRRLLEGRGDEDAVSLRAVAREAGIAAPSIYAHFPNSEAIIGAVVAETFAALTAALRKSRDGIDDPVQRLSAQCYAYLRFAEEHPGLYRVLFARARGIGQAASGQGAAMETALKNAVIVEAGTPAFDILVDAITSCVEAGRSASRDPFLDAVALWSALHGYVALRAADPEFPWPDERTTVDAMIASQARLRPA
jgi:AcrR family transcriptional regulator